MDIDYQFSAGHRLDDFEIEAPLYKGALSEVYRANDLLTRQTVAIKVPSSDVINHPLVYYHYQNEMRILAHIHHPNVVSTIRRQRTSAYSIFEYLPGTSLRRRLQRQSGMPLEQALDYARQIAGGLNHLHDCGIIHLDIKPDNILITPSGRIKIIDFGLARQLGAPDLLFEDFARPHGTPDYVSPEQLAHHRDDPCTDQFSLALVLYEMLTGRLPYEKNQRLSYVRRRIKHAAVSPRRFREEIPRAVASIILKALSVQPEARYPSIAAFRSALQSERGFTGTAGHLPPSESTDDAGHGDQPPLPRECALPIKAEKRSCILAAIADDDQAESVTDAALQAAMTDSRPVTLLTVVNGSVDDDWIRYSDEARGKRMSQQFAKLSLKFGHFGIDPSVRIRSGKPADVIIETAKALEAGLIVIGPAEKRFFKRLVGGGTLDRVLKRSICPVVVSDQVRPPMFPVDRSPEELTYEQVQQADTFLTALWIGQVDWLAAFMKNLFTASDMIREASIVKEPMETWLGCMRNRTVWAPMVRDVQFAFAQLLDAAGKMRAAARHHDRNQLCRIYLQDALPLVCRMREALKAISAAMRQLAGLEAGQPGGLLRRPACPVEEQRLPGSGPIQQLQTLRTHFCTRVDSQGDRYRMVSDHGQVSGAIRRG